MLIVQLFITKGNGNLEQINNIGIHNVTDPFDVEWGDYQVYLDGQPMARVETFQRSQGALELLHQSLKAVLHP